ncbi:MAG: carboxypeptidase regulatory-like domain-containing protein [Acidobacteria bacterium]|nr:carboxypeptidase regulatory-like domain-containing protein [Acidobacteriota bacterium]
MQFLLCLLAAAAVRGTVIDDATGKPIAGAEVRLALPPGAEVVAETSSDENGDFTFDNPPSGAYVLAAAKDTYLDLPQNSFVHSRISVRPGSEIRVTLPLTRAAVITGKVLDASGRPVRQARVVSVLRRAGPDGVRLIPSAYGAGVDDRGSYRLFGLPPGRHLIAATPAGGPPFLPVYFPGVTDPAKAEPVNLRAGEVRASIDFAVWSSSSATITGRVTGRPEEWADRGVAVSIFPAGGYAAPLQMVNAGRDGRFRFEGVPSGSYVVVAAGPVHGYSTMWSIYDAGMRSGRIQLDAGAGSGGEVEIALSGSVPLEGELTTEGGGTCHSPAQVGLDPLEPVAGPPPVARSDAQGRFRFAELAPVRYRVFTSGLKPGCFVKELRLGGKEMSETLIPDGVSRLRIILTTQSGTVYGRTAAPQATVILTRLGADGEIEPDQKLFAAAGKDGEYRVDPVGPGRYLAIAMRKATSNHYLDPLFWADHKEQSVRAVVEPGANVRVDLPVLVPRENWR